MAIDLDEEKKDRKKYEFKKMCTKMDQFETLDRSNK